MVKVLINSWINDPSFLNSSFQFEKNRFIKLAIFELILNDLLDPNDISASFQMTLDNEESIAIKSLASDRTCQKLESNNLINHCVKLLFTSCKTGYQIELISDLMRTLVQYGARPSLNMLDEPYSPESFMTSVRDLVQNLRSSKRAKKKEYQRCKVIEPSCVESGQSSNSHQSNSHHRHRHHHHRHHHKGHRRKHKRHHHHENDNIKKTKYTKDRIRNKQNYFLDYFNEQASTSKILKHFKNNF